MLVTKQLLVAIDFHFPPAVEVNDQQLFGYQHSSK